ncbi:hypothetical protein [Streptomyces sp. NPDC001743]|uniref:hypothetical protein n=1 Tax=Streptomyces sp. NPDC001743 TaxID=3154397 RepID=UPI00332ADCCE
MTQHAKIGAALVGGYLLGRTKKAKLALGFGMFLIGKKIDLDPRQIGRMLADSPVLGSLNDQVRKELVDATRTAATKAVTQRAGSLADSLQKRTRALGTGPESDDEDAYEPEDEAEYEDEADQDEGEEREPAPRKAAAKSGSKAAASKSRSSSGTGRSGSTGKSSAPARKRTGAARKTAASGARKARGGDDA